LFFLLPVLKLTVSISFFFSKGIAFIDCGKGCVDGFLMLQFGFFSLYLFHFMTRFPVHFFLWNALPISLRQPHLSLGQFRRALKTHFFDCVCRA